MANGQPGVAQDPCCPAARPAGTEPTDGQLLDNFARLGDQAAFAALVRRHGPMVLGVCRRVLRHAQDAEDAFQATFLVLVHKAGSLEQPHLLASWLHGVAYRTAQHARSRAARRCLHEREAAAMSAAAPDLDPVHQEQLARLDEELGRLPDKYRAPLVLCYLEGLTHAEAARRLGWPIGSMSARVAKARDLLHRRLAERRNGAQALLLPLTLLDHLGTAEVPVALMKSTLQAAAHVATGAGAAAAVSPQVHDLAQATLQTLSSASWRWLLRFAAALALALGLSGAAYAVASDWSWPTSLFSSAPPANAAPSENPDGASCSNSSCCH